MTDENMMSCLFGSAKSREKTLCLCAGSEHGVSLGNWFKFVVDLGGLIWI